MADFLKMALALVLVSVLTHAHSSRDDMRDDKSDDMEHEEISRRRSWQYEGMTIEDPKKPRADDQKSESKSITEAKEETSQPPETTSTAPSPSSSPPGESTSTSSPAESSTAPLVHPPLNKRYRRIYNADETAKIEDHPYLAAVLMNNELWCGGVIIATDQVFTAAHCLQLQYNNRFFREYVKMLTVRIGSDNATAGGEEYRVDEIFFHPNYKPQTLAFNFAVLRLNKNITLGPNVTLIEYSKRRDVTIDKTISFLGWGSVLGMHDRGGAVLLQKVELPVYDRADCADIYGRELVGVSTFCAGYISKMKNVCNHDAGGPALMDGQVVGILSFSSKRCDEPDKPAVFSSSGAAAEWLDSIPEIRQKTDELHQGWMNDVQ